LKPTLQENVLGLFGTAGSAQRIRDGIAASRHAVLGTPLDAPLQQGQAEALFGCGCFWGAEKGFWRLPGVITTAVGYAGGASSDPTYQEVC
jgi:peptide-methionine (S)-S-oxide reductase